MFDNSLSCHVFEDYDIPFDEKGTTIGTVRRVQWVKDGNEPDEAKSKIEIRKMYIQSEGERMGKGYTFSTPEGPGELTVGLVKAGFGDTKEILKALRNRDDLVEAAENIDTDDDSSDGEMFDMRSLMEKIDISNEDDVA